MQTTTFAPDQVAQFNSKNVTFDGRGAYGMAVAGGVANIDLKVVDVSFLTGGRLKVKNGAFGDFVNLQVVDVDNIMGAGAGYILRQFVSAWYISDDQTLQDDLDLNYPAKIYTGLYLRIEYHSTGTVAPAVAMNYDLHMAVIP